MSVPPLPLLKKGSKERPNFGSDSVRSRNGLVLRLEKGCISRQWSKTTKASNKDDPFCYIHASTTYNLKDFFTANLAAEFDPRSVGGLLACVCPP